MDTGSSGPLRHEAITVGHVAMPFYPVVSSGEYSSYANIYASQVLKPQGVNDNAFHKFRFYAKRQLL